MQNNNKIKAIFFDMIGVLFTKIPNYIPNPLVDEMDKIIGQVTNDQIFKQEVLNQFKLNKHELDVVLEKIVAKYELFVPLWNLLPKLKKHFKLGIINNGTALTLPKFKMKYPIDKYFDIFISSAIEGIKKPDSRIYIISAERLKVKLNECLFIDDNEDNIVGAKKIGMNTILWKNEEPGLKN